jgi:hypothetical protein
MDLAVELQKIYDSRDQCRDHCLMVIMGRRDSGPPWRSPERFLSRNECVPGGRHSSLVQHDRRVCSSTTGAWVLV